MSFSFNMNNLGEKTQKRLHKRERTFANLSLFTELVVFLYLNWKVGIVVTALNLHISGFGLVP